MGLRMQPVGQVFQRFNRLVRDLGRQLDREVSLVTSGEDVEIDKSILDNLGDSLVHLIRNSVDHGLESGDERVEAGKPRAGRVYLRASQIDNSVVIEVGDDGRGLDLDRIFARGRERGLVGEVRPDDAALAQLIFEPGFSTAAAVTAVSGRGVGMDAVRRNIEAIGGRVDVSTQRGQGSCFRISLPLTLAIIDGLLFELGGERYVLPLDAVEECVEAPRRDATSSRQRLVEVRGEQVPYLSLREFLRVDVPGPDEQVVVANFQGRRFGFLVDAVVGQHQTVLKGLDPYSRVTGMAGATILGDGSVALVLDGQRIAELVSSRPTTALAS